MHGILYETVARTLHIIDILDDLIAKAAMGFAVAAPMIIDASGDAPVEPDPTRD